MIVFVAIPLILTFVLFEGHHPQYEASSRLLTADPAAANNAAAIATSQTQIASALTDAGVVSDPVRFGTNNVTVQPVGTSGVVEISVIDPDPRLAAGVANSLANRVLCDVLDPNATDCQIADLNTKIAGEADADPQKAKDVERLKELESNYAGRRIIETALPGSATVLPSSKKQVIALSAVFGVIVGIMVIALIESLDPTVIGGEALTSELGTPVLGEISGRRGRSSEAQLARLGWGLRMRAGRAGARTVALTAAASDVDLRPLSEALQETLDVLPEGLRTHEQQADATTADPSPERPSSFPTGPTGGEPQMLRLKVAVLDPSNRRWADLEAAVGVVVVSPTSIKRADLRQTEELLTTSGWPILGLITYPAPGLPRLLGGIRTTTRAMQRGALKRASQLWLPRY